MTLDPAAGGAVLLVLMTSTWAGPVPRPPRAPLDAKACHLDQFKSLSPKELQAFKKAKDAMETWLRQKALRCSSRLLPRAWDLQQLQVWERPVALQAELVLTQKVLENVSHSALETLLAQPLRTLSHIRSRLQACVSPEGHGSRRLSPGSPGSPPLSQEEPPASSRPHSRRLARWLLRLQEAPQKETPGCLQEAVTLNLFRLLLRDLRCVASGQQGV